MNITFVSDDISLSQFLVLEVESGESFSNLVCVDAQPEVL